uniref:Uncharacterized protein n=1 Tax=Brassica oleracea TaxID=3712 RepID=A0A3P6DT85_BRAOL|nr:unnamed protein product [Brassica oleracea]
MEKGMQKLGDCLMKIRYVLRWKAAAHLIARWPLQSTKLTLSVLCFLLLPYG